MTRKRKSDSTPLDEAYRTLYSTFCSAANSLSQLYTHAMNHQKVAFQAGERQALEKLYQWITKQHEEGSRVTAADIVAHIENEIDYGGDDAAISPRLHFQHQFLQSTPHLPNSTIQTSPGFVGQHSYVVPRTSHSEQNEIDYGGDDAAISPRLHFQHQFPQSTPHLPNSTIQTSPGFVGQHSYVVPRTSHSEQVKNSVLSNAFSSPIYKNLQLQPYQLAQEEGPCGQGGTRRNYVHSSTDVRESNSPNPNDTSMEIH